jgi:hypothetical protein
MKGRGCRPLPGIVDGGLDREARLAAIAASDKDHCLIVDLVGITGLADCASSVQIYAEGLSDEIQQRAEDILAEQGLETEADVEGAIEQAKREDAEAHERARAERLAAELHARELAERRAKAGAEVTYTSHEMGVGVNVNTNEATEKQYRKMGFLGMDIQNVNLSKRQAGRIIDQLLRGISLEEVARTNRIHGDNWSRKPPTANQRFALRGVKADWVQTPTDASLLISARKNPREFEVEMTAALTTASDNDQLTRHGRRLVNVYKSTRIDPALYARLVECGKVRRARLCQEEF